MGIAVLESNAGTAGKGGRNALGCVDRNSVGVEPHGRVDAAETREQRNEQSAAATDIEDAGMDGDVVDENVKRANVGTQRLPMLHAATNVRIDRACELGGVRDGQPGPGCGWCGGSGHVRSPTTLG